MMKSGVDFSVTTPMRCTSDGSRGSACATRFCTCTCALSRSVPSANVTVSVHPAVGCRLREHVEHVLDAVDLLLERRGHGFGNDLRVRARIGGAHDHGRRHHLRVLADRQPEERQRSGHDNHQRQHGREDRTIDEELREFHDDCSIASTTGVTCTPGRTRCRPLTTTDSPALRPLRTTRKPSTSGPSVTVRY